jgi:hypothetical protein
MRVRTVLLVIAGIAVILCVVATQIGFYSVQPIGVLPDGVTLVVWRQSGEPFFNSADAMCLQRTGGVSLICRIAALGHAPKDRIIMRLSYWDFAYLQSTDGAKFEK